MTILWRRWYDRNDFIFFWHRRIFIKTTSRALRLLHTATAIEYGNLHIGRRCGRMPAAIPLIPFVCISVDVSSWFLCIVCLRLCPCRCIGEMLMFCVMLIWFAFWRTNTFRFAASHYASFLWTTFGWTAWIYLVASDWSNFIKILLLFFLFPFGESTDEWIIRNQVEFIFLFLNTNRCTSYNWSHRR